MYCMHLILNFLVIQFSCH